MNKEIQIPVRFNTILSKDMELNGIVLKAISDFNDVFVENKLYFFEEYTDHGFLHINQVLAAAELIIKEETFNILKPKDVSVLILSILLHDLGMHISYEGFISLINGDFDYNRISTIDEKTWKEEWNNYQLESLRFSRKQLKNLFGSEEHQIQVPNLDNKGNLTSFDRIFIGEFIRRHHPRLAHEIALNGFPEHNKQRHFGEIMDIDFKMMSGIVARSHGIGIRDTFEYLKTISSGNWKRPFDVEITFLMFVLRIADFLQIDVTRISIRNLKHRSFISPYSHSEFLQHSLIKHISAPYSEDPETIYVEARPDDNLMYLKIKNLLISFQYELDMCWAVLGEIYGKDQIERQPRLKYRRIISNINNKEYIDQLPYIHEPVAIKFSSNLLKLLAVPLYGSDPIFGFKELLTNSIDSCFDLESQEKLANYKALIDISINEVDNESYEFRIRDNGKGMALEEIKDYFLVIGDSSKTSNDDLTITNFFGQSKIMKTGKFGIGVLSAFLLGEEIHVETKKHSSSYGYKFKFKATTDQIEIRKDSDVKSGTVITILLNKITYNLLTSDRKNSFLTRSKLKWTEIFCLNNPVINYSINGVTVNRDIRFEPNFYDILPENYHEIQSSRYQKVMWSYNPLTNHKFIVNGFPINDGEDLNFSTFWPGNNSFKPNIRIFDFDGNLKISLNRQDVDFSSLDFWDDMQLDINLKILAEIFFYDIKFESSSILNICSSIQLAILWGRDGYIIQSLLDQEHIEDFNMFSICTFDSIPSVIQDIIEENSYYSIQVYRDWSYSDDLSSTAFEHFYTGVYYTSKLLSSTNTILETPDYEEDKEYLKIVNVEIYEALKSYELKSNYFRNRKDLIKRNDLREVCRNNNWVLLSGVNHTNKFQDFEFPIFVSTKVVSITLVESKDMKSKMPYRLEKLYYEYFGAESIPYNLEDRIKKFPKAYSDLIKNKDCKF